MAEQIFISYRRSGGDIYAKSICEALKNRGYTVFYDIDSISGGYFDDRILNAIAGCDDFLLVLPPNSLDRCWNEGDWVRLEILEAMKHGKNIIPVLLPGFTFPADLPADIAAVARYNGVSFVMQYFDAVIDAIVKRLSARTGGTATARTETPPPAPPKATPKPTPQEPTAPTEPPRYESEGLSMVKCEGGYKVTGTGTENRARIGVPHMYMGEPVISIGKEAFRTLIKQVTIDLPRGLRELHPLAFAGCYRLTGIEIDAQNPYYCVQSASLFTKDMKTLIRHANLRTQDTYTVPEGVLHIHDFAFMEEFFEEVKLPESLQTIGAFAFRRSEKLELVEIPQGVTSIGEGAFWGCHWLRIITLPEGIKRIESGTFSFCSLLSSVALPKELRFIGACAFDGCSSLRKIEIPASVTEIDREAFKGCTSAQEIIFAGTKKEWKKVHIGDGAFKDVPARVIKCTDGEVRRWFI